MKISQIMLSSAWGGAEQHVVALCRGLQRHGLDVQLICRARFVDEHGARFTELADVATVHARGNWDRWSVNAIEREMRRFGTELAHTHLSRAALLGGKAANRMGIPCITTTHNAIKPKYLRQTTHFITTTREQTRHLHLLGRRDSDVHEIPNFSTMPPIDVAPVSRGPVFASIGRLTQLKGYDVLLKAFAEVLRDIPDASLLISGAGPEANNLRRLCSKLGLRERVEFCGPLSDIAGFLSRASVFVLPSREEAFGSTLLNPMARGVPVVATQTAGPLHTLGEDSAWFCPADDPHRLAQTMLECWAGPDERAHRAARAKARYLSGYYIDQVVPEIIAYYETLVAAR